VQRDARPRARLHGPPRGTLADDADLSAAADAWCGGTRDGAVFPAGDRVDWR
jgi:hypothetical protein